TRCVAGSADRVRGSPADPAALPAVRPSWPKSIPRFKHSFETRSPRSAFLAGLLPALPLLLLGPQLLLAPGPVILALPLGAFAQAAQERLVVVRVGRHVPARPVVFRIPAG